MASNADLDRTFDVIIAGAGAAGCVLAGRLSERPDKRVLLIEAGPDATAPGAEHPEVLDPFALAGSRHQPLHWPGLIAETGADPGDGGARASTPYTQGYGVGGGSNINGMGADRGLPQDYEEWRELGAEGWGWDDVLPYFKKMERDLDFSGPDSLNLHGDSGPLPVRRVPRDKWAPFTAKIAEALERRGFNYLDDYMTDHREGFAATPTNSLPDRRVSASMAYLTQEVRRRPNFTLLCHARVDRIEFKRTQSSVTGAEGASAEEARAEGLHVHVDGATRLIRGRRIIVSCGAIQSPALLMRSGIGPAGQLHRHDIEVIKEAPGVGANLQNHPTLSLIMFLPRAAAQPADNISFLQNWLRYSSHHPGCHPIDMHLMPFNKADWHYLGRRVGMIAVSVLKSYSKGRIELSSPDPAAAPKVLCNFLADERDYERMVGGLRFTLELLDDPAVGKSRHQLFAPNARLVASLHRRTAWNAFKARMIAELLSWAPLRRVLLGRARIDHGRLLRDEGKLRDFVRRQAHLQLHVCCTCRMGRADDPEAVVDGAGRVYGVQGVQVVDASIFPTVPRGYTHFLVIMAAEKIADAIKSDWGRESADLA